MPKTIYFILMFLAVASYFTAWLRTLGYFGKRGLDAAISENLLFSLGFILHTSALLLMWRENLPLADLIQVTFFLVWCFSLVFLVANLALKLPSLSAMAMPAILLMFVLGAIFAIPHEPVERETADFWLKAHIAGVIFSLSMFTLAFVGSFLYLLQDKRLKDKKNLPSGEKSILPPLELLNRMNLRFLLLGFPAFSFTLALSFLYFNAKKGDKSLGFLFSDPLVIWGLGTWLVYGWLLHLRINQAGGKRMAVLSIVSFVLVVCSFLGVRYLAQGHQMGIG